MVFDNAEQAHKYSGIASLINEVTPGVPIAPMATHKATIATLGIKLAFILGDLFGSTLYFKNEITEIADLSTQLDRIEKEDAGNANADTDCLAKYIEYLNYQTLIGFFTN